MPTILLTLAMMAQMLTPDAEKAAFTAAGFKFVANQWRACGDPGTASYEPGSIQVVQDMNGDGQPEAILMEGSADCFGQAGYGYWLVSRQANGSWRVMTKGAGMVTLLPTRGVGNWPDLEIGGPGFCFPVQRWNGQAYVLNRKSYNGKPCR